MKSRPLAYPNLILYNGKIRTFTSETSTCEALACAGSRIVATGNSDDIRRLANDLQRQEAKKAKKGRVCEGVAPAQRIANEDQEVRQKDQNETPSEALEVREDLLQTDLPAQSRDHPQANDEEEIPQP